MIFPIRDHSKKCPSGFGLTICLLFIAGVVWQGVQPLFAQEAESKTNFLLITVDDMNWDSLGVNGCSVPNISPNLDALAAEGMLFRQAHVTIAVCQPCRAVWMTGRYPHNNGAMGFEKINQGVPTLPEQLKAAGYYNGLLAKVAHVVPSRSFAFDVIVPASELHVGRSPEDYYQATTKFLQAAKDAEQPFFLMANAQDPHRPFAGSGQEKQKIRNAGVTKKGKKLRNPRPSNFPQVQNPYSEEEVTIPGFLPDLPNIRKEMAEYYTSVRRADQVAGKVLQALEESGLADNTLVMFLSDHGMPLPFGKTNCYLHSTRTPWIVRWPGKVKAGVLDKQHFISGIDLTPTVLAALNLPPLEGMDGTSFLPVLLGQSQPSRTQVFTQFHRTSGKRDYPMRSIIDAKFGYIYNDWADGEMVFKNESQSGLTMAAMKKAADKDPQIAARVDLFLHRVPEELYNYEEDPDALENLADKPEYQALLKQYQKRLLDKMEASNDPLAPAYKAYLESKQ
ncbi:N-sulfoglucosamine sulfohydrolase [Planctomycetales bacterium 10988]|nr:N-sulfoglucosamine sulfohydrolase [Planctomycetales bacterium 10988]